MYYEKEVKSERCNQAHNSIKEISNIVDKFYNREPRTVLKEKIRGLEKENRELRIELKRYKEIVSSIQILQGEDDE